MLIGADTLADCITLSLQIANSFLIFELVGVVVRMRLELGGASEHVRGYSHLLLHLQYDVLILILLVGGNQAFLQ